MTDVAFVMVNDHTARVNFRYDPALVALVKDTVPGAYRAYDPVTKTWTVTDGYIDVLDDAIVERGHSVTRRDEGELPPPVEPTVESFFGVKGDDDPDVVFAKTRAADIVNGLEAKYRHRVLREMAKLLYPDLYSGRR